MDVISPGCIALALSTTFSSSHDIASKVVGTNSARTEYALGLMVLLSLKFLINSLAMSGRWISSAEAAESTSKNMAPLWSFLIPIIVGVGCAVLSAEVDLIASFSLERMSASECATIVWSGMFGALSMSVCWARRSHLANTLECRLMGFVVHAASAAAYVGNEAP